MAVTNKNDCSFRRMLAGEWTGTMNLTEPHCGTDLGMMRTKAVKRSDGSYSITGTKIFISGGEQDISENIVHLVLARVEGAPAGIKESSLFVVPKRLVNPDGSRWAAPMASHAVRSSTRWASAAVRHAS